MCVYIWRYVHEHKVLCLALVCIYVTDEGELEVLFLHTQIPTAWGHSKPGNKAGFADWPEEEKLDSP